MMLGEVASTDYGGSKANWIKEMFSVLPRVFPKVRALIWFEVNDRGTHWPIETPPSGKRAFAKGIRNSIYVGNIFSDIEASPIPAPRR